jgi:parallel beta-helix repeat protein
MYLLGGIMSIKRSVFLLILSGIGVSFLIAFFPVYAESKISNYYVASNGSDKNAGLINSPFKTIQHGIDVLKAGGTLYVRGGTYNEKVVVKSSGEKDKYITIQNYSNEKVIINGSTKGYDGIINISDKNYIRVKGLELCNNSTGSTPMGVSIGGSGEGVEILNNKVYNIKSDENAHGIAVYGTNGSKSINKIKLSGNELYNMELGQSESMVVNGNVQNFEISNNVIHDNNNIGIDCIGFEGTASENDQARNGVVINNIVYNISASKNRTYSDACADGIYVDGGKDIVIERNKSFNCDIGIEVASEHLNKLTSNVVVRNNLVYGCSLYGISFGGADSRNGYSGNCKFLNNTIYNNKVGINISKTMSNEVKNNIIYGTDLLEGNIGSNKLSNNLWYSPNKNTKNLLPFKDPKFVNTAKADFAIAKESPAVNAGDSSSSLPIGKVDLVGNNRISGTAVDCGAIEYNSSPLNMVNSGNVIEIPTSTISPSTTSSIITTEVTSTPQKEVKTKKKSNILSSIFNSIKGFFVRVFDF